MYIIRSLNFYLLIQGNVFSGSLKIDKQIFFTITTRTTNFH